MSKNEKDLKPLIDGDPIVYRAGFSADSQIKKQLKESYPDIGDDDLKEEMDKHEYLSFALGNVKTALEYLTERFNENYTLFVHAGGNFREKVATILPYKGNRDRSHVPKYKDEIIQYMFDTWKATPVRGMESDDAICIEQHRNTDKYSIICSIDKDILNGMYGWSFNPMRDEVKFTTVREANNFFFWQMLVGDASDNIPGIKGIGPKKASALVEAASYDTDKIREAVKAHYRTQYGAEWEQAYNEVGTLLYILRRPEELTSGCPLL